MFLQNCGGLFPETDNIISISPLRVHSILSMYIYWAVKLCKDHVLLLIIHLLLEPTQLHITASNEGKNICIYIYICTVYACLCMYTHCVHLWMYSIYIYGNLSTYVHTYLRIYKHIYIYRFQLPSPFHQILPCWICNLSCWLYHILEWISTWMEIKIFIFFRCNSGKNTMLAQNLSYAAQMVNLLNINGKT